MQFPAKILLFGEYGLILGGSGLVIPYSKYSGELKFGAVFSESQSFQSHQSITHLFDYLTSKSLQFSFLNLQRFKRDLEKRIWFDANIPFGYGLGSSGALIAAIYDRYVNNKSRDLVLVKQQLAAMESYFHGSSSGVDPLVSFVKQSLILQGIGAVEILEDWSISQLGLAVFLVDTGEKSKTISLVDWFKAQMTKPDFKKRTEKDFLGVNELVVNTVKASKPVAIDELLKISRYQLDYLSPMVPESFRSHFFAGLNSGNFAFKLCGSGGGGFMLCLANNEKLAVDYLAKANLPFQKIETR